MAPLFLSFPFLFLMETFKPPSPLSLSEGGDGNSFSLSSRFPLLLVYLCDVP